MRKELILALILFCLGGCATPAVNLSDSGRMVKVGKSDPADNYTEIGPITATDGSGCGAFGSRGTYNRAVTVLKNKASLQGGDYVQIFTLKEPHFRPGCFDNVYTINGTLFKKTSDRPSPVPIVDIDKVSGIQKLRNLKSLLDDGVITQEEFEEQKTKILNNGL